MITIRFEPTSSLDDLKYKSTTFTASNEEEVFQIKLKAIYLYGEVVEDIEAIVMSLLKELKIDGILGLNFLRHFKVILDVSEGILILERK